MYMCVSLHCVTQCVEEMSHIERVTIHKYMYLQCVTQCVKKMSHIERVTIHIYMCIFTLCDTVCQRDVAH